MNRLHIPGAPRRELATARALARRLEPGCAPGEFATARALVLRLEPDGDRDELVTALDERVRTLRGAFWLLSRNQ